MGLASYMHAHKACKQNKTEFPSIYKIKHKHISFFSLQWHGYNPKHQSITVRYTYVMFHGDITHIEVFSIIIAQNEKDNYNCSE